MNFFFFFFQAQLCTLGDTDSQPRPNQQKKSSRHTVRPGCPVETLLDLILARPDVSTAATVVPQTISDHFAVEACLQLQVESPPPQSQRLRRKLHKVDMELLHQDLAAARLHEFENHDDVNKMWDKWYSAFMQGPQLPCTSGIDKGNEGFSPSLVR